MTAGTRLCADGSLLEVRPPAAGQILRVPKESQRVVAVGQALSGGAASPSDRRILLTYCGLVACLAAVAAVPVPT